MSEKNAVNTASCWSYSDGKNPISSVCVWVVINFILNHVRIPSSKQQVNWNWTEQHDFMVYLYFSVFGFFLSLRKFTIILLATKMTITFMYTMWLLSKHLFKHTDTHEATESLKHFQQFSHLYFVVSSWICIFGIILLSLTTTSSRIFLRGKTKKMQKMIYFVLWRKFFIIFKIEKRI